MRGIEAANQKHLYGVFGEGGNDTLTDGMGADTATDFIPGQGDTKTGVENF